MKRLEDLRRLANGVLTFSNADRLSHEQSKAVVDMIDMMKEIIAAGQHEPTGSTLTGIIGDEDE